MPDPIPLEGLRRIGIDEISYKKGHRYLIVIVDHDTARLIWAAPGRDKATLNRFFDALGKSRCARLREVSADGADWIAEVVRSRCLNARLVMDALSRRRSGRPTPSTRSAATCGTTPGASWATRAWPSELKGCRYALWKNPANG